MPVEKAGRDESKSPKAGEGKKKKEAAPAKAKAKNGSANAAAKESKPKTISQAAKQVKKLVIEVKNQIYGLFRFRSALVNSRVS